MNVNHNKIHVFHDIANQIESLHDFIYRIVSSLPPTNNHGALTHQSAPLIDSLNYVARSVWAHSSLFSHAVQDGELTPVDCPVLRADRDPIRHAQDPAPPPDGSRMFPRPVQTLHAQRIEGMGQNVALGPPYRPEIRP